MAEMTQEQVKETADKIAVAIAESEIAEANKSLQERLDDSAEMWAEARREEEKRHAR